jgi:hypothetical protein
MEQEFMYMKLQFAKWNVRFNIKSLITQIIPRTNSALQAFVHYLHILKTEFVTLQFANVFVIYAAHHWGRTFQERQADYSLRVPLCKLGLVLWAAMRGNFAGPHAKGAESASTRVALGTDFYLSRSLARVSEKAGWWQFGKLAAHTPWRN